jgi:thiol-disulfide isomerase/thioredoxin
MKMKKIWVIILAAFVIAACNSKPKEQEKSEDNQNLTIITGKIENNTEPFAYLTYNSVTDTVKIDENGQFTAKIMISNPTGISFVSGRNYTRIYALPQSTVNFTANATNFFNTLSFTGNEEEANNYLALQSKTMQNAGLNTENFLYAADHNVFLVSLNGLVEKQKQQLDEFATQNTEKYPDFVLLETERLKMLEASLILTYYTPLANSDKIITEIDNRLNSLISEIDLNNPKMINVSEFKPLVQNYIAFLLNKQIKSEKIEFSSASQYAEYYFAKIDEVFIENTVREEVYYSFLKDFIAYYGAESVVEVYSKYRDIATNKTRLSELEKIFSEYNKLAKGQPSVNWSFPDVNGKYYSLSDFKGKYVYIDVWAAWCGPCKRELPFLAELKEKFSGKNIEIIGISVDENREDWINMLQSQNMKGIQLHAGGWDNELCNHFKITGIPRFILLDKAGNIINANADRPSGNIEEVLNGLEGI